MSSNPGSSSLRPGWHKGSSGRGFQPPPTVSAERGDKARSSSWGSQQERRDSNKFAALDDEDDGGGPPGMNGNQKQPGNSRSEAFRSSFRRETSAGQKTGRSLADLAASVPETAGPTRRAAGFERGGGRFSGLRSTSEGSAPPGVSGGGTIDAYKPDPKVIRYTREKLLSRRPPPRPDQELPEGLKHVEGAVIIAQEPQDPVCWDTFDAEEIWGLYRERRMSAGGGTPKTVSEGGLPPARVEEPRVRRPNTTGGGRWQRGVALPPPDEAGKRGKDADNPNELWDDPIGGATGAASDFSAFGGIPEDPDAFDFDKMAEASKKLEEELHGSKHSDMSDEQIPFHKVDATRPLASVGMTISSGSGDDVNVFEDFDPPTADGEPAAGAPAVRSATENPSASSRLMQMIGVTKDPEPEKSEASTDPANPWGGVPAETSNDPIFGAIGGIGGIPVNPWGGAVGGAPAPEAGMDLSAVFAAEQKAREQAEMEKRAQEQQILRRRQEEEAQRLAMQRQAEEQARQQQAAAMQQQQATQQSQVELVLMERICSILENSWGRSDLVSILTTLHSEDSRVIPLLGNEDALRALIARSPQRVALRRDPSFGGDIAQLLLTNSQWQQAQARMQQEELELRRQMEEEARAQAQHRAAAQINPNLPWFYSDPQNNIQGPFRGEEMRQWLEAGYFKGDLPISQQPSGPFVPLSALFKDLNVAFRDDESSKEEAEKQAAEEEMLRQQEEEERRAAEAAAKADAERRAAEERERLERERAAAAEAEAAAAAAAAAAEKAQLLESENDSSNQLKMMLGLAASNQAESDPSSYESPPETVPIPKKQTAEKKQKEKKMLAIPVEEEPMSLERMTEPAKPVAPAAPAWGGAASAKPKKSMSEIQQEEARAAARMAAQRETLPRQSSSGWANVAATGKAGWDSEALKPVLTAAVANPAPPASGRPAQARQKNPTNQPVAGARKASPISQRQSSTASSTPAEEFGATMSPALEKWCKEQMQKINGNDDLTLVAFCMTLNDANEIRQYLTTYLGGTSQVNTFATEFINKRGLGSKQEEWETPGSAKKGRKKKGGR